MSEGRNWYENYQEELRAEQSNKSREEVLAELQSTNEYTFDPDTAPKQGHNWVDRGLVMSCENAAHPYHQAFKRLPMSK